MPYLTEKDERLIDPAITIASGASLSTAILTRGFPVFGIFMPAAWTAANLTFQASFDDVTYQDLYDKAGTEFTVTAAASRHIGIPDVEIFSGIRYLKVRSGTAAVPVNQAATRTIVLLLRDVRGR